METAIPEELRIGHAPAWSEAFKGAQLACALLELASQIPTASNRLKAIANDALQAANAIDQLVHHNLVGSKPSLSSLGIRAVHRNAIVCHTLFKELDYDRTRISTGSGEQTLLSGTGFTRDTFTSAEMDRARLELKEAKENLILILQVNRLACSRMADQAFRDSNTTRYLNYSTSEVWSNGKQQCLEQMIRAKISNRTSSTKQAGRSQEEDSASDNNVKDPEASCDKSLGTPRRSELEELLPVDQSSLKNEVAVHVEGVASKEIGLLRSPSPLASPDNMREHTYWRGNTSANSFTEIVQTNKVSCLTTLSSLLRWRKLSPRSKLRSVEEAGFEEGHLKLAILNPYVDHRFAGDSGESKMSILWANLVPKMKQTDIASSLVSEKRKNKGSVAQQTAKLSIVESGLIKTYLMDIPYDYDLLSVSSSRIKLEQDGVKFCDVPKVQLIYSVKGYRKYPRQKKWWELEDGDRVEVQDGSGMNEQKPILVRGDKGERFSFKIDNRKIIKEENARDGVFSSSLEDTIEETATPASVADEDKKNDADVDVVEELLAEYTTYDSKASKVPTLSRPTFTRVHRKHMDPETLDTYELPWEWDTLDNNYLIIKQTIPEKQQDILFEHTRKLREGKLLTKLS